MNEIITSREQFYVPVSLDTHDVFCFDEREIAEAEGHDGPDDHDISVITPDEYIRWAGGALNIPYNFAVVGEAQEPGGVTGTFATFAGSFTPVLIRAGVRAGVHSDTGAEQGARFKLQTPGKVGCGYAELRPYISQHTAENGEEIIADAAEQRPELFQTAADDNFARAITSAHGRLAQRGSFFPGGRSVVLTAAAKGANVMLVKGAHTGTDGVINLAPNSSIHGGEAIEAGLPVYNQDSWATEEARNRIRHVYPHDGRQHQIAELIDTIGTMRVLGVKNIAVRR